MLMWIVNFQPEIQAKSFHRVCQQFIKQYQQELQKAARETQGRRYEMQVPKLDVLKVMCSSESELVKRLVGGQARRYAISEGDLSTVPGREKLFEWLILHDPEHVWYSPECGPWGKRSSFNMGNSVQGLVNGLEKR